MAVAMDKAMLIAPLVLSVTFSGCAVVSLVKGCISEVIAEGVLAVWCIVGVMGPWLKLPMLVWFAGCWVQLAILDVLHEGVHNLWLVSSSLSFLFLQITTNRYARIASLFFITLHTLLLTFSQFDDITPTTSRAPSFRWAVAWTVFSTRLCSLSITMVAGLAFSHRLTSLETEVSESIVACRNLAKELGQTPVASLQKELLLYEHLTIMEPLWSVTVIFEMLTRYLPDGFDIFSLANDAISTLSSNWSIPPVSPATGIPSRLRSVAFTYGRSRGEETLSDGTIGSKESFNSFPRDAPRKESFHGRSTTLMLFDALADPATNEMYNRVNIVVQRVKDWGGVVIEVRCDQVLAGWNVWRAEPKHVDKALGCMISICNDICAAPEWWSLSADTGTVSTRRIGASGVYAPVLIGRPLRQIRVLPALAEVLQMRTLVTESSQQYAEHMLRLIDVIPEEGGTCDNTIRIFTIAFADDSKESIEEYNKGFSLFILKRFDEAYKKLQDCLSEDPTDYFAKRGMHFADVSRTYVEELGPPPPWPVTYTRIFSGWKNYETEITELQGIEIRSSLNSSPLRTPLREAERSFRRIKKSLEDAIETQNSDKSSYDSESSAERLPAELVEETTNEVIWRSEKKLGKGAYGVVWQGMGLDGSLIAMKALKIPSRTVRKGMASPTGGATTGKSLLDELYVLSTLKHAYIVSYKGCCLTSSYVVLCMECVMGGSLEGILTLFGSIPLVTLKRYARCMVSGLAYLHRNNVTHCDLKPSNILLAGDGTCKLTDFGTVVITTKHCGDGPSNPLGTPLYMAPEASNGSPTQQSDIWSLGITVLQMLTGEPPYSIEQRSIPVISFLRRLANDPTFGPEVPEIEDETFNDFLLPCLKRNQEERGCSSDLANHPFLLS